MLLQLELSRIFSSYYKHLEIIHTIRTGHKAVTAALKPFNDRARQ